MGTLNYTKEQEQRIQELKERSKDELIQLIFDLENEIKKKEEVNKIFSEMDSKKIKRCDQFVSAIESMLDLYNSN